MNIPRIHMNAVGTNAFDQSPYLCGTNTKFSRWYARSTRDALKVTCKRCLCRMFWTA